MKKPEDITTDAGFNRAKSASPTVELPAAETRANSWTQAWAKVRSWFEIPYGYEDDTGFHYGEEPVTCRSDANALREVFTDRACDTAMFMAATTTETSPAPAPEPPANVTREKHEHTVNPS